MRELVDQQPDSPAEQRKSDELGGQELEREESARAGVASGG